MDHLFNCKLNSSVKNDKKEISFSESESYMEFFFCSFALYMGDHWGETIQNLPKLLCDDMKMCGSDYFFNIERLA